VSPRLESKIAIVTGAGQSEGQGMGNGRATAIAFAREGATVVLADRDEASARETAETIGERATVVEADVGVEDDCARIVATCVECHGRVDVLHHNVGTGTGDGWAENLDMDAWERIMRVNAGSAAMLAKAAVPAMREQGGGAITHVSSIAAVCATTSGLGNPPLAYKMSKAALNALTQSLAQNYAAVGIRVNTLMPGLIDTPMGVDVVAREFGIDRDHYAEARNEAVPLKGGMGSAWDVANAAVFLASDEARFITGALLPVDGGQSCRIG
jgi:NAD(P)-dependent dehydrogenase (short-subunit alcohol dehydrogenase family)